ncbi:MAG: hypothetical protein IPH45_07135 [Bacteroidales bacterium]|nr:hypothetical protein [Bacteroidales bacterium]
MKHFLNTTIIAIASLVLISVFSFSGCKEEVETIPVIDWVKVTPDTITSGGIALVVTNAYDEDGDELVYSFTTTGGVITGYGDSVYWLAPLNGGKYNAIVRVTDPSGNQTIDSVSIFVLPSGKTEITGTASFPAGINQDLSEARVRLFTSLANRAAGISSDSVNVFGFGSIVSFRFPAVTPGVYYLDVWKDMDNSITISSGDFLGWYGSGTFAAPDLKPVVVQDSIATQVQVQVNVKQ